MLATGEEGRSRGTVSDGDTTCWELASDEVFSSLSSSEGESPSSSSSTRKGSGVSGSMNVVGLMTEAEGSCSCGFD